LLARNTFFFCGLIASHPARGWRQDTLPVDTSLPV
jgi:hypothetical protein